MLSLIGPDGCMLILDRSKGSVFKLRFHNPVEVECISDGIKDGLCISYASEVILIGTTKGIM